jgi:hypothetical protein
MITRVKEEQYKPISTAEISEICAMILDSIILMTSKLSIPILINLDTASSSFDSELFHICSLNDYIKRIVHYTEAEGNMLILTMMNLDKLLDRNKSLVLNKRNCHKYLNVFIADCF